MTEILAASLTVAVLARFRVRPSHVLRDRDDSPATSRRRLGRRVRGQAGPAELAAWCDALARDVRAGATLGSALRSLEPPPRSRLGVIGMRLHRGVPLDEALDISALSVHERAVTTVLGAVARAGGPAAQPLDRVAATLRRRAADDAERTAQSAQARLSALIMTLLPGVVLGLLLATSQPVRSESTSPLGAAIVTLGVAMNILGWLWMRRLIRGKRP